MTKSEQKIIDLLESTAELEDRVKELETQMAKTKESVSSLLDSKISIMRYLKTIERSVSHVEKLQDYSHTILSNRMETLEARVGSVEQDTVRTENRLLRMETKRS